MDDRALDKRTLLELGRDIVTDRIVEIEKKQRGAAGELEEYKQKSEKQYSVLATSAIYEIKHNLTDLDALLALNKAMLREISGYLDREQKFNIRRCA